jgi:hypothetical protein
MKTGRVRKKAQPPPEEKAQEGQPPVGPPASEPSIEAKPGQPLSVGCIVGLVVTVIALAVILILVFGGRGDTEAWIKASGADGSWTTSITVFGPQVTVHEEWQDDCVSDPLGTVRPGTCYMKNTDAYRDTVVDEYEEYAYDIHYEETWDRVYQVQGTEFAVASLGTDDWWEDDLHYTVQEELDKDSCEYSSYTLWVDDPDDSTQETEVYLSECEVWDHVVVYQRVYEQEPWCQCDVTALVPLAELSEQGGGTRVLWASPDVPSGGSTEQSFQGQVTFLGDDHTYTVTTTDPEQYEHYLTGEYYIGLRDGKPVGISASPPDD